MYKLDTYLDLLAIRNGIVSTNELPSYINRLGKILGADIKRMSRQGLNSDEILFFINQGVN